MICTCKLTTTVWCEVYVERHIISNVTVFPLLLHSLLIPYSCLLPLSLSIHNPPFLSGILRYFTDTTKAAELTATLLALAAQDALDHSLYSLSEGVCEPPRAATPALFWASTALLRCCGQERHVYHLALRLVAIVTHLTTTAVGAELSVVPFPALIAPPFDFNGILPTLALAVLDEDPAEAALGRALVLRLLDAPVAVSDPSAGRVTRTVLYMLPWLCQEKHVVPPSSAAAHAATLLAASLPEGDASCDTLKGALLAYDAQSEASFLFAACAGINEHFLPSNAGVVADFLEMATSVAGIANKTVAFHITSAVMRWHGSIPGDREVQMQVVQEVR